MKRLEPKVLGRNDINLKEPEYKPQSAFDKHNKSIKTNIRMKKYVPPDQSVRRRSIFSTQRLLADEIRENGIKVDNTKLVSLLNELKQQSEKRSEAIAKQNMTIADLIKGKADTNVQQQANQDFERRVTEVANDTGVNSEDLRGLFSANSSVNLTPVRPTQNETQFFTPSVNPQWDQVLLNSADRSRLNLTPQQPAVNVETVRIPPLRPLDISQLSQSVEEEEAIQLPISTPYKWDKSQKWKKPAVVEEEITEPVKVINDYVGPFAKRYKHGFLREKDVPEQYGADDEWNQKNILHQKAIFELRARYPELFPKGNVPNSHGIIATVQAGRIVNKSGLENMYGTDKVYGYNSTGPAKIIERQSGTKIVRAGGVYFPEINFVVKKRDINEFLSKYPELKGAEFSKETQTTIEREANYISPIASRLRSKDARAFNLRKETVWDPQSLKLARELFKLK